MKFSIALKRIALFLLCCTISLLVAVGCSPHRTKRVEVTDHILKNDINNSISCLYPDKFKAVHRAILTLAGKNYVLNGYLFVDRPNREVKLIAQNDLGGIIFDIHFIENVKNIIHVNVDMIKQKWIERSTLRDLKTLYLKKPFPSPMSFFDPDENLIISQKDGLMTQEFIYEKVNDPIRYRLNKIRHLKKEQCLYTVDFKYGTVSKAFYPEVIVIQDTKMKYNLQIDVRYFM